MILLSRPLAGLALLFKVVNELSLRFSRVEVKDSLGITN
jgi:hypothetical protein